MGYLERNEPLPLDQPLQGPGQLCTVRPLQHTPLQAISKDGFRTPAKATDKNVRLAWRYQGYGGTRFVQDNLAGDPKANALASNGQGPPSITERLRSTADGAQAAANLIGAGAAELAAAQAFCSQLLQDAAKYVRLNVLPRRASRSRRRSNFAPRFRDGGIPRPLHIFELPHAFIGEKVDGELRNKHGRHQPAGAGHSEPRLFHPEDPGLRQRPALRRH